MNEGFILLHRKLRNNILWPKSKPFTKLEAWIDLLMMARFDKEPVEVLLGNEVVICERGQIIRSINTYQKRWNWGAQRVKSFFEILLKLNQIEKKTTSKTTIITICNYDSYQGKQQTDNKQIINGKQTDNKRITTKNKDNKENKENNVNKKEIVFNFRKELLNLGIENQIVEDWLIVRKNKNASNTQTAFIAIKKQIELSKKTANECIKIAVEESWSGLKAEWIKNLNGNGTPKRKETIYDINKDIRNNPNRMSFDNEPNK